ncbi:MAG: acetyltransferase [Verrucomicrobiae bacterium]|nr:acetyltransferase [Verrucomicrobiae bacterium]
MTPVKSRKWFLLGAGGQARMVIAAARAAGLPNPEACLVDEDVPQHDPIPGIPLLTADSVTERAAGIFFPAIGDNAARRRLTESFVERGWQPLTLCHPRALVEKGVRVGAGTVIAMGAIVQSGVCLGQGVIVNTGAIIEHDVVIGDYSHIAPGSILLGESSVGENVLIGAGTRLLPRVRVESDSVVGAGSVVLEDIPAGSRFAGVPARALA